MKKKLTVFLKKTFIYSLIVSYRVWIARKFLRYGNIYPNISEQILSDFRYSIKRDFRGILQVINIEEAIQYVAKNNIPGCFIETGVFTGGASAYALKSMVRNNCIRDYFGFDSFGGMPPPTEDDGLHGKIWAGENPSAINYSDYDACIEYLIKTGYPPDKMHLIKGWFQETLHSSKNQFDKIAILRLDGDFYESTKIVLNELYDKVADGGIVIIDDYGSFEGCKKAVDEFLAGHKKFLIYVDNGVRFFVK